MKTNEEKKKITKYQGLVMMSEKRPNSKNDYDFYDKQYYPRYRYPYYAYHDYDSCMGGFSEW